MPPLSADVQTSEDFHGIPETRQQPNGWGIIPLNDCNSSTPNCNSNIENYSSKNCNSSGSFSNTIPPKKQATLQTYLTTILSSIPFVSTPATSIEVEPIIDECNDLRKHIDVRWGVKNNERVANASPCVKPWRTSDYMEEEKEDNSEEVDQFLKIENKLVVPNETGFIEDLFESFMPSCNGFDSEFCGALSSATKILNPPLRGILKNSIHPPPAPQVAATSVESCRRFPNRADYIYDPDNDDDEDEDEQNFDFEGDYDDDDAEYNHVEAQNDNGGWCRSSSSGRSFTSRKVSFSSVDIQEFSLTLGDHPSAASGPPIMLDSTKPPISRRMMSLDEYERIREGQRRTNRKELRLSLDDRKGILINECGFTHEEINKAWAEATIIRQQRKETLLRGSILTTVDGLVESVNRKCQRLTDVTCKGFPV